MRYNTGLSARKHPPPHPQSIIPPCPTSSDASHITLSEEDILRSIMSFPNGSAGGPDGLRPQHLKDLISTSASAGGPVLLRALTDLVNIIVKGDTPSSISPFFFGASLIALEKKGGGVRPIAIGCILRRLAAKAIGSQLKSRMGDLLAPRQLGYGTPHGCEVVVHAVRMYLHHLSPDNAILKLDFSNAINTIHRDIMLKAVQDLAPELLCFMHSVYSAPSTLFWKDECLLSYEGVQQGDPLGPLLFCLTLHQLSFQLRSEHASSLWTMAHLEEVKMISFMIWRLSIMQLMSLVSCLICKNVSSSHVLQRSDSILSVSPQLQVTMPESVSLLGSPLGDIDCISDIIQLKVSNLETMGVRLQRMHAHDALQLLRHSFALPKMMHILCTAPCLLSSCLTGYDDLLRSILSHCYCQLPRKRPHFDANYTPS